jgi:Antitoxin VbhA
MWDARVLSAPSTTLREQSIAKGVDIMTETQKVERRVKAVRAIRRSTELEGSHSTDATRADQDEYTRGAITAAELGERVRRRYNAQ